MSLCWIEGLVVGADVGSKIEEVIHDFEIMTVNGDVKPISECAVYLYDDRGFSTSQPYLVWRKLT